jgi:DUF4097 and DUF4098 domain-containing protein YvlB
MKNAFLKICFAAFVFTAFSFSFAGYAFKRAKIANPNLVSDIGSHYRFKISDSENGFFITSDADKDRVYEKSQKNFDIDVHKQDLVVLLKNTDVQVDKSPDAKLHIIAEGWLHRENPESELINLEITKEKITIGESITHTQDLKLKIQVPAQVSEIYVVTLSGEISIADISADRLETKTTSADIEIENTAIKNLEVHSMSGSVSIQSADAEKSDITLKSMSGDIINPFPGNHKSDKKIAVTTMSGDIEIKAHE